jgi:hypothetical protein
VPPHLALLACILKGCLGRLSTYESSYRRRKRSVSLAEFSPETSIYGELKLCDGPRGRGLISNVPRQLLLRCGDFFYVLGIKPWDFTCCASALPLSQITVFEYLQGALYSS